MRYVLLAVLFLFACTAVISAEEKKFSLQLDDVDISQALADICREGQVSVMGDPTVKGRVSCNLVDVSVETALTTVCKANRLEWMKAWVKANAEEKPVASKLFKLYDALNELGEPGAVFEDPRTGKGVTFLPSVQTKDAPPAPNLRPIYLIRAEPGVRAALAEKEKQKQEAGQQAQQQQQQAQNVPSDPQGSAAQIWDHFTNMDPQYRSQVFRELGRMYMESLSPEQREAMGGMMRGQRGQRNRN